MYSASVTAPVIVTRSVTPSSAASFVQVLPLGVGAWPDEHDATRRARCASIPGNAAISNEFCLIVVDETEARDDRTACVRQASRRRRRRVPRTARRHDAVGVHRIDVEADAVGRELRHHDEAVGELDDLRRHQHAEPLGLVGVASGLVSAGIRSYIACRQREPPGTAPTRRR